MTPAPTIKAEEFRIRGHDVSRLEALSDGVFALALTLLIVRADVPETYKDLMHAVRGFPAFAICFSVLIWIWHAHYTFFRRYALHDHTTIVLNCSLLFVVLFYVYPLKYVFGLFIAGIMGIDDGRGSTTVEEGRSLFTIYGLGFAVVWAIMGLMHAHAYRVRRSLDLNPMEELLTRAQIGQSISRVLIGVASILIARVAPDRFVYASGWVYFLMGITETVHGTSVGHRARKLAGRLAATESAGPPSGTAHPPRG